MLRIQNKNKLTPRLKKRKEEVSTAINSGKEEIGNLQQEIKMIEKDKIQRQSGLDDKIQEHERLNCVTEDKLKNLRKIDKQTAKVKISIGELVKKEEEGEIKIKSYFSGLEKELGRSIDKKKRELEHIEDRIIEAQDKYSDIGISLKNEQDVLSILNEQIINKTEKQDKLDNEIIEKTNIMKDLILKVGGLEEKYEKVEKLEIIATKVKQEESECKDKIRKGIRELKNIKKEKEERLVDVVEREKMIESRENNIKKQTLSLNDNKSRIETLGKTLQKHFDSHDMKHIKVFK